MNYHIACFYCLYLCVTKSFVLKNESYFAYFFIWFMEEFDVRVLKVLCFWSSLYKVIGNQSFFDYSRYAIFGTVIKTVL